MSAPPAGTADRRCWPIHGRGAEAARLACRPGPRRAERGRADRGVCGLRFRAGPAGSLSRQLTRPADTRGRPHSARRGSDDGRGLSNGFGRRARCRGLPLLDRTRRRGRGHLRQPVRRGGARERTRARTTSRRLLGRAPAVAIGPTTARALTERGYSAKLAESATLQGLARSSLHAVRAGP